MLLMWIREVKAMKARLLITTAAAVVALPLGVPAALAGGTAANPPSASYAQDGAARFPSGNQVSIPAVDYYETRAPR